MYQFDQPMRNCSIKKNLAIFFFNLQTSSSFSMVSTTRNLINYKKNKILNKKL